jgi:NAD(P)-dependent dehydrogenase (short-subunit alcohol dehydrogenase family)
VRSAERTRSRAGKTGRFSRAVGRPLDGVVALVAGATRGAGRGIACMLGEAGAIVYCSGRSTRGHPPAAGVYRGRPETIEETAGMVTAFGGEGVAARTDHLVPEEVEALVARIRGERGRLDVLVNDISEGVLHDWRPFWKVSLEKGLEALQTGVVSHVITSRLAVPLMVESGGRLVVEVGDGDFLDYRATLFYDLVKANVSRLAFAMAHDLFEHRIAAVAVTPGFMRTEFILDRRGVTEENWRDAVRKDPHFAASETPFFVGRAVAALAADPKRMEKTGGLFASWTLSDEYGFTDVDGARPHWGRYWKETGLEIPGGKSKVPFEWRIERKTERSRSA